MSGVVMSASAVLINSDSGECTPVAIKRTDRGNWTMGRTKLHLHHNTIGFALLSPIDPRHLQSPLASIFEYPLPPPLDAYIYPEKLIIARYDADTNTLSNLSSEALVQLCADLDATSNNSDDVEAVYDVPAMAINYEKEEEEDNDYFSEVDDDIIDESDGENESIEDEDQDWDDDDDVRSTT